MLKIEDLKVENKFKRITPESKEQFNALEKLIVADVELHSPIIIWAGQGIVVDGHSRLEILKKHPDLKYSLKEIEFDDWMDVIVWIVEHHIARSSFTLWQKLEMAMACVKYWEAKEKARRNQGVRNDLKTPGVKKSESIDTNAILAEKVGCGTTTVTQFLKVFNKASEATKQKCKEGDMSIKRAYESLAPKKTTPKKKSDVTLEIATESILDKSKKNQSPGKKSNIVIPDPKPIATKMTSARTSEGSIWFAINPIEGVIQIFNKSIDQEKGKIHIEVDNYSCKTVSKENGVTIVEACHIDGSTEHITQKDNINFEEASKKAS